MTLQPHLDALARGDVVSGLLVLLALMIAHALCDFPLQGDYLALRKNRHYQPPDEPQPRTVWPYCLTAHALIHAGGVWAVTGLPALALAELVLHWWIDLAKAEGKISIHVDQALHFACKVAYVVVIACT